MRFGRTLAILCMASAPAGAFAAAYAPLNDPGACGGYEEAEYDGQKWFPGGEGGLVRLDKPTAVRGMDAVLYDAVIIEEGFVEPVGRMMFLRSGPYLHVAGPRGLTTYRRCS